MLKSEDENEKELMFLREEMRRATIIMKDSLNTIKCLESMIKTLQDALVKREQLISPPNFIYRKQETPLLKIYL